MPGIGLGIGVGLNQVKVGVIEVIPNFTINPVIEEVIVLGSLLSCDGGVVIGTEIITKSYQWKRGITNIGTNSSTYTLTPADLGQNITCTVTATNYLGSSSQISNTIVAIYKIFNFSFDNTFN